MDYSSTYKLAQDIRDSEEYKTYHELKESVMQEETTAALIAEYRKNFPEQPKPITSENDGNKREGYTCRKIMHDSYLNSSSVTRSRPQDKVTLT